MRTHGIRWTMGLLVAVTAVSGCNCGTPLTGTDAGSTDAGQRDSGLPDSGQQVDAGVNDAGTGDAGLSDAGEDAGELDAGLPDSGEVDGGLPDSGEVDAGGIDAGEIDAGLPDAGQDAGTIDAGSVPNASITDAQVQEGNFGTNQLAFVVSLDTAPAAGMDATISWATADGTAVAGTDYIASSGTLTFTNGGALAQRITVPIIGNTVQEPNKTFTVVLTVVANVGLLKPVGTGTILNDDFPSLSIDNVTQLEPAAGTTADFVFTVSLSSAPEPGQDVSVQWATAPLSASAGTDFIYASAGLTFTSGGPTTQNVTITVKGNGTPDLQKEFEVVLSNPTFATLADPVGLGTIIDVDGKIIRVDPTATGTPDGLTWATAFPTLQAGVNAAAAGGGQVWVAGATYTNGGGTGPVLTLANNVTLLGGFDGYRGGAGAQEAQATLRDWNAHPTILDGQNTAYHVVMGTGSGVLDGFTITHGNANGPVTTGQQDTDPNTRGAGIDLQVGGCTFANDIFQSNSAQGNGGAINAAASFTAHDTQFLNNSADNGGAVYTRSQINLFDDTIEGNTVGITFGGQYGGGVEDASQAASTYTRVLFQANRGEYGGGLHLVFAHAIVRNCSFINNVANGGTFGDGAGLYVDSFGAGEVHDSVFIGNSAVSSGGGIEIRDSSTLVTGCVIENNAAPSGAGIFNWNYFGATQHIINTRIAYNRASQYGGGVYNLQSNSQFTNCVFEGNDGSAYGGAMYNQGSSPGIDNTLFLNDTATAAPEMQNDTYNANPVVLSSPVATNVIIENRTFASPAVVSTGGSSLTLTSSVTSDAAQVPGLNHEPMSASRTTSGSTASVLNVPNGSAFAVGDTVEVGGDGVARSVTAAGTTSITISPPLSAAPAIYTHIDNWGAGATDVNTDIRLLASSICIDSGSNASVPQDIGDLNNNGNTTEPTPFDFFGNPRFVDDPTVTDTGSGTPPIVDIGPVEHPAP